MNVFGEPMTAEIVDEVARLFAEENLPAARFHAGCRLKFGPDRKLYITTGDATDGNIAQDLASLGSYAAA